MTRNPYAQTCQQRCVYAKALVAECHEKCRPVLEVAMLQGAVYQLHCAYVQHMRQIAENYSCPEPWAVNSVQDLDDACLGQGVTAPEAVEMRALLEDDAGWLGQCVRACEAFQEGHQPEAANINYGGAGRIAVYQEAEQGHSLDVGKVELWVEAMIEMTERHRELMCEY